MKKIVLLLFILIVKALPAQEPSSVKFDRIFGGCSGNSDTLHDLQKKNIIYVLTNNKTQLTAYRSHKKKWSLNTADLIQGSAELKITCMEFYKPRKKIVLRIHIDQVGKHIDINPKTGKKKKIRRTPDHSIQSTPFIL